MVMIEARDGRYSLAVAQSSHTPFGVQGIVTPTDEPTETWARNARADFTTSMRPLYSERRAPDSNGKRAIRIGDYRACVRDDLELVVGVHGPKYTNVDYLDGFSLADAAGLRWDSMAVLGNGEQAYGQAKIAEDEVRPGDHVASYWTIRMSHDGSCGIVMGWAATRIVCKNTLARATKEIYKSGESVRHTAGVFGKLDAVAESLQAAHERRKRDIELYRALAKREADEKRAKEVIAVAFPGAETDVSTRTSNVRKRVLEIFDAKEHNAFGHTEWDLWQAITAYTTHEQTVRGVDKASQEAEAQRWLRTALEGSEPANRAFQFLTRSLVA